MKCHHFFCDCSLRSLSGIVVICFTKDQRPNQITLNPIRRFSQLNRQKNTRYLPMYILKNTRHPPQHNEFRKKVSNLGDRLSSIHTQGPPVVLIRPGRRWRCWQAVKKDGLSTVFQDLVIRAIFTRFLLFLRVGGCYMLDHASSEVL